MSILITFKNEFERIALLKSAAFTNKKHSEIEKFAQGYDFAQPLINYVPIERIRHNIGASSQMIYKGDVRIQFLTKAVLSDNFETTKDLLIDQMLGLSEAFFRTLFADNNRVFNNPEWDLSSQTLRFHTANYLVGIESTITFTTACNRLN